MPFAYVCERCGASYTRPGRVLSRFCSRKCQTEGIRPRGIPATIRFWKYVTPTEGCWVWQGMRHPLGYGAITGTGSRKLKAHRLSWEIHNGPIPEGMQVLHNCDNPPCVNPAHLRLGTHADNMADMAARGRAKGGDGYRFHQKRWQRGEDHGHAIATEATVRWIREQRAAGVPYKTLAAQTGLAYPTVYAIANRLTWKHVA